MCLESQKLVPNSRKDKKKKMACLLKMVEADIAANIVLVGHGHLQHTGSGRNGAHALQYHNYFILEGEGLKDVNIFAYVGLLGCKTELCVMGEHESSGDASNKSK